MIEFVNSLAEEEYALIGSHDVSIFDGDLFATNKFAASHEWNVIQPGSDFALEPLENLFDGNLFATD